MLALTEILALFTFLSTEKAGGGDNAEKNSSIAITDGSNDAEDEYSVKGVYAQLSINAEWTIPVSRMGGLFFLKRDRAFLGLGICS